MYFYIKCTHFVLLMKYFQLWHKDNKRFSQLQEIGCLVLNLEIPLLSLFLPRTNPKFNFIILSQPTSNITDSLMHATLAKLVKKEILLAHFLELPYRNLIFFPNITNFLTIFSFYILYFLCRTSFQAPNSPFKFSRDSLSNSKLLACSSSSGHPDITSLVNSSSTMINNGRLSTKLLVYVVIRKIFCLKFC